jgi:hypothetical protein
MTSKARQSLFGDLSGSSLNLAMLPFLCGSARLSAQEERRPVRAMMVSI